MFGPNRDEIIEEQGKLHRRKLCDFYAPPGNVTEVKSRRIPCHSLLSYTKEL
jgi:hypothetical protein